MGDILNSSKPLNIANKILLSVGEPFLSAPEEALLPQDEKNLEAIFNVLFKIMQDRKSPQASLDRLKAKALLDNVEITPETAKKKWGSNIALGFGVDV